MNVQASGNFTLFPESRPTAVVVSHERSGTHFLMNQQSAIGRDEIGLAAG